MEEKLVDAFTQATQAVFAMMAGTDIKKDGIVIDKHQKVYGDVSGVIGFTGQLSKNINGSVAITLPADFARKAVANMLAMDESELTEEDIQDGVGELINMIAGDAKSRYNDAFKISLPTVITGLHHSISGLREGEDAVIAFKGDEGTFFLQISLEEK